MLTCNECMKRCLQTVIGESTQITTRFTAPLGTRSWAQRPRNYATYTAIGTRDRGESPHRQGELSSAGFRSDHKLSREDWLASRGVRPPSKLKPQHLNSNFSTEKHLTYLKDPLKLAEHIRSILRKDDFDTAQELVRTASKSIQCVVSWNHLLDWQLSKGKMNAAIKSYNEMKKRAQMPDAHTYTIIFRGCAEHPDSRLALTKVLAIYHSMLAEKARIQPNTIHMNAVLKMCAKAQDMDALFSVVGQMPFNSIRAPNNLTYTTIFNALRANAAGDRRGELTNLQQSKNKQAAILNARYMWKDIVSRWRTGDIWIDEELVCSMGRLLVLGTDADVDDVFSLVEQAMNVPRQFPRNGTLGRRLIEPSSQGKPQIEEDSKVKTVPIEQDLDAPAADQFDLVKPPNGADGINIYARPGQNTLSLLMLATLQLRLSDPATKYWDILTGTKNVNPDAENYNAYLRVLRLARASTKTAQLLMKMPKSDMKPSTFHIAMSTCSRDKNNSHAFANAGKILDLMQGALAQPELKVLETYLDVAITSQASTSRASPSNHSDDWSRQAQGAQIVRALDRLGPSFVNIRALLKFGDPTTNITKTPHERVVLAGSVLSLTQRMIGAYDMLLEKGMVPREQYRYFIQQRSKLAAFVTRYRHKKQQFGPSLRKSEGIEGLSKPVEENNHSGAN